MKRKPGRPSRYKTLEERKEALRKYQHEYYLKVTKQKRAERRQNEAQE